MWRGCGGYYSVVYLGGVCEELEAGQDGGLGEVEEEEGVGQGVDVGDRGQGGGGGGGGVQEQREDEQKYEHYYYKHWTGADQSLRQRIKTSE